MVWYGSGKMLKCRKIFATSGDADGHRGVWGRMNSGIKAGELWGNRVKFTQLLLLFVSNLQHVSRSSGEVNINISDFDVIKNRRTLAIRPSIFPKSHTVSKFAGSADLSQYCYWPRLRHWLDSFTWRRIFQTRRDVAFVVFECVCLVLCCSSLNQLC